jgi:CRP/FNR family transcriptional regulator, anaerobic regulatory protein
MQKNEPSVLPHKIACGDCTLFQLCLPVGMDTADIARLERIIQRRRPLQRGDFVFRMGEDFHSIYAVSSGSVKTYILTEDGREQVTGFHLPGELLGLNAVSGAVHPCTARALETTSLCEIPFDQLETLWTVIPALPRRIMQVMGEEILHDQTLLMLMSKSNAEERLAAYLLNLSLRFGRRGYSVREYHLSMSRSDIGNYLGLAVETVSRIFTRFQDEGVLGVQRKHVQLLDIARLKVLAGALDDAAGPGAFSCRTAGDQG